MSDPIANPQTSEQTPSQTIGPYYAIGLTKSTAHIDYTGAVSNTISGDGDRITIEGQVFDGDGQVIEDAMIEIFQADASGSASTANFLGLARSETGDSEAAEFTFDTIKPGSLTEGEAPYIAVVVYLRGLLLQAYTRIYFSDEAAANLQDPIFCQLPADRRDTLIATRESPEQARYRFDIHMQGENETLFFKV